MGNARSLGENRLLLQPSLLSPKLHLELGTRKDRPYSTLHHEDRLQLEKGLRQRVYITASSMVHLRGEDTPYPWK